VGNKLAATTFRFDPFTYGCESRSAKDRSIRDERVKFLPERDRLRHTLLILLYSKKVSE